MKRNPIKKNIIEIIFLTYILIAFTLYFYINNLSLKELHALQKIIEEYYFLSGGGYTYLAIEYSKLLNQTLSIFTFFLSIFLIKYRSLRNHHRRTDTIGHYTFVIFFLSCASYFLWIKEWKLFSSNDDNYIKEIPMFIIITCGLNAILISEFWYFIDMLEKIYKKIVNKQDEQ